MAGRLVGTVGKGIKAWHVDTKRMVAHVRLDPSFPDVCHVACSPADPSFACASSSSAHGPGVTTCAGCQGHVPGLSRVATMGQLFFHQDDLASVQKLFI